MTHPSIRVLGVSLGVAAVLVTSCGKSVSDKRVIEDEPASLEEVAGSDLLKVTLTERAAERLGIQTASVTDVEGSLVVPSGALWLDTAGVFWVYTNPEPYVYLRHEVAIDDDDGERVLLSSGPPVGTKVVTVGVPELFGAEVGVGK